MIYRFLDCVLDIDRRELRRADRIVPLEPQVFDLLVLLAENAGRVVTRDEIVDHVWQGRIVSESAISARIATARKAVGDDGKTQAVIRTVHRRGLQFAAPLDPPQRSSTVSAPKVRYTTSDCGKSLAYAISGQGPRLLRVPATPADIGMEWELPGLRTMVQDLSSRFELLRYDGLGFGMSDRDIDRIDHDRHADCCRAVADAAGWDRFAVFSESGANLEAIHFAAKYPERISNLILVGGYADGRSIREPLGEPDMLRAMIRQSWEAQEDTFARAFMLAYMPEGPMNIVTEVAHMMRASGTTETVTMLRDAINNASVADILHRVQCPTLIVHGRKDAVHPLSEAKKLAAGIPNSELLILETANHLPVAGHATWEPYLDSISSFVT